MNDGSHSDRTNRPTSSWRQRSGVVIVVLVVVLVVVVVVTGVDSLDSASESWKCNKFHKLGVSLSNCAKLWLWFPRRDLLQDFSDANFQSKRKARLT